MQLGMVVLLHFDLSVTVILADNDVLLSSVQENAET